jgi:hypothetical protein
MVDEDEVNNVHCSSMLMPSQRSNIGGRCVQGLVGKPEGKRPMGRARRGWEDNTKMDLQEVGCGGMDWIEIAQYGDK